MSFFFSCKIPRLVSLNTINEAPWWEKLKVWVISRVLLEKMHLFLTFCGQIRCACSSGKESSIDLLLPKKLQNTLISLNFIQHLFLFFSAAPASTAAPVWTASTPSRVCARRVSPGATASTTSMSATPNPAWMAAPARTATAPTSAPAHLDTLDSTVRWEDGLTHVLLVTVIPKNVTLSLLFSQVKRHLTSFELYF